MLALRLNCSTAALIAPKKVLSNGTLVELKMLDLSDRTRTGVSILTSAGENLTFSIFFFFGFGGISLKDRISHLPKQPCWLYP